MGTWDDIRREILAESIDTKTGQSGSDLVRRRKIQRVEDITKIPLITYVVDFVDEQKAARVGASLQIDLNDKTGFSQATSDIPPGPLDVLIHSPGGSPTATESLVHQLRSRYDPIRFIVPHTAKSAATMLALSGNEVLLGPDAELGPIDPQLRFSQDGRVVNVPAQAALDQFEHAYQEISGDPKRVSVWLPIIRQFGPSFMQECRNAIELARQCVSEWLRTYMFAGDDDAETKAERVSAWLAEHNNFKSHSRQIRIEQLLAVEPTLRLSPLTNHEEGLEDAVMEVYWAYECTFNDTTAFKMIEHKHGSTYVRSTRVIQIPGQPDGLPALTTPPGGRNQRRRDKFGRR